MKHFQTTLSFLFLTYGFFSFSQKYINKEDDVSIYQSEKFNNDFIQPKSNDSLFKENRNIIYWMPTATAGDLAFDLRNIWVELGYYRLLNPKNYLGFKAGVVVHYTDYGLLNIYHSKGYNFSIEHKYKFKKSIYYSSELSIQNSSVLRYETANYGEYTNHLGIYRTARNVVGFTPKIGIHIVALKRFYMDFAFGCGIRYISSKSSGKKGLNGNLQKERFVNKYFDDGSKFAQRVVFQIKLGVSF